MLQLLVAITMVGYVVSCYCITIEALTSELKHKGINRFSLGPHFKTKNLVGPHTFSGHKQNSDTFQINSDFYGKKMSVFTWTSKKLSLSSYCSFLIIEVLL